MDKVVKLVCGGSVINGAYPCLIFILCHRPPKDSNKVEKKGKPTKKVEEEDNKSEDEEMDAKEDAEDEDGE